VAAIATVKAACVIPDAMGINLYSISLVLWCLGRLYQIVNAKSNNSGYFHQTEELSRLQKLVSTLKIVSMVLNLVDRFLIAPPTICVRCSNSYHQEGIH
jgi:hypothetical protein